MISAFARASQVFGDPAYGTVASRAAEFTMRTLFDSSTGNLLRRYRDGESKFEATLSDYALVI